ncbi:hypothetical protein [Coleofasciculus sp. FACHB-SPT9]|uniref:hypothetical protein n=1 Tax=Cyanophyceae TaxID=3028117 RepID=UPI0016893D87|nr:hypothetical protein [Coleofasciculus sp. FACHB-SPT9]MBD1890961.1 hypothetical protein [Coleofasciculus sp. FACHB-SPT9]
MKGKWLVLLEGKESYLRNLTDLLRSPECSVIKEEGSYYLSSSRFDLITDEVQVCACATELLTRINAAAMVYFGDVKPFTLDVIVRVDEDGKRNRECLLSATWTIEDFGFDIQWDGSEDFSQHPSYLETWIKIAGAEPDDKIKKVFRILTERKDWVNLYKVYEVVQEDVGKRITEDGWATKKKTECFSRTAQSPGAIGDDARHGVEKSEPPKNPMSLLEAQRLIIVIVRKWLEWKSKEQK